MFSRISNKSDLDRIVQQKRSAFDDIKNEITATATGKITSDMKEVKQADKQAKPIISALEKENQALAKALTNEMQKQTTELAAIKQLQQIPFAQQLPAPSPAGTPGKKPKPSELAVEELFANGKPTDPQKLFTESIDKFVNNLTKVEVKKNTKGDYVLNGKEVTLDEKGFGLESNNKRYPFTTGLSFLLASPFAVFTSIAGRRHLQELKDSVTKEDAKNFVELLNAAGYKQTTKKNEKYEWAVSRMQKQSKGPVVESSDESDEDKGAGVGEVMNSMPPLAKQLKGKPYKLISEGGTQKFGDLTIDMNALGRFKLRAFDKDGKLVLNNDVDPSFIDLLLKRYNAKKVYSDKAIDAFRSLAFASNLEHNPKSAKYKLLYPDRKGGRADLLTASTAGLDLNDLVGRLPILMGSLHAGNNSDVIFHEAMRIIDTLLDKNVITQGAHTKLFNQLLGLMQKAMGKL